MVMHRSPKKFVGLHAHCGSSAFDGLGPPKSHFEWCLENGLEAHALTDHGHMNSYASAQLLVEDWKKSDKKFRYIPGVEAYFHPDLEQWKRDRELAERAKEDDKQAKKLREKQKSAQTSIEMSTDENDEVVDVESSNALTIENEDETKSVRRRSDPVNRRHHLVLLPKSAEALKKIFNLVSRGYTEGFYRFPRIDLRMIREAGISGDVVASSACIGGQASWEIFQVLKDVQFDELSYRLLDDTCLLDRCVSAVGNFYQPLVETLGEGNVFLELQFNRLPAQHLVNRTLIEFARRNGLTDQLLVTCDSHYPRPELWKEREMYKKLGFMRYGDFGPDTLPKDVKELKAELYPKNAEQVWRTFLEEVESNPGCYTGVEGLVCDAVERSHTVAFDMIGEIKPDRSPKFPKKLVPHSTTAIAHLTKMCVEGMKKRGLDDKDEYIDRLHEELGVIRKLDVAEYFITLEKIMRLARSVTLVGPGRGSGAGSLVNYVLEITDMDPIKWDLPFARFMSVYRVGMPDVDNDVGDRDTLLELLKQEFGDTNILPISNVNTFKVKTLVKDLAKFHGIPFDEVNSALKTVENDVRKATLKAGDDKNLFVLKFDEAMEHSKTFREFIEKHPQLSESVNVLFKEQRSLGRHAGGVLVLDDAVNQMPLITNGGEAQTPWQEGVEVKHLEKIGNFVKYDILVLATLRLIERTIELILKKQGKPSPTFDDVKAWFDDNMSVDRIDFDDQRVYEYVYHGKHGAAFPGIFQCTSSGAQKFFMRAKPRSIADIATLTSIYRPGPLAANVDDLYVRACHGEEYDWGDRRINEILKKSKGLLIFQEGVMSLAEHVAGFPKEKCDDVRRAILKRSISGGEAAKKAAAETRASFVEGALKNGYKKEVADDLYDKILYFAGYGFNAGHAFSYAIDSYWCAWLMTHHEEEWLCAYLEHMCTNPDDRSRAFAEIRSMGYTIVPMDVNHAKSTWTIMPGKKFMPSLSSCKGLGDSAIEEILQNRPYRSIEDLLWDPETGEWRHSKFNKKALEALISLECLDSLDVVGQGKLFENYAHMRAVVVDNMNEIKKTSKREPDRGRKNLYRLAEELRGTPEWTREEKIANKLEYVGYVDPTEFIDPETMLALKEKDVMPIDALEEGSTDIVWLVIQNAQKRLTKNGKTFVQANCMGETGQSIRLMVWGWKDDRPEPPPCSLCLVEVKRDEGGYTSGAWKFKVIDA